MCARALSLSLALFTSYSLISLALSLSSSLFFSLSAYPTPPWWALALNSEVYNIRINFYEQVSVLEIATLRYDMKSLAFSVSFSLPNQTSLSLFLHLCLSISFSLARSLFARYISLALSLFLPLSLFLSFPRTRSGSRYSVHMFVISE